MENYNSSSGTLQIVPGNCDSEEYVLRNFPAGWYFKPTDEELISEYLNKKINDQPLPINLIHEENIYHYHPHVLCGKYELVRADEWYFFTPRDKKYPNGNRPSRTAGYGYWKATGADFTIRMNGKTIGSKNTLVYWEGSANNKKGKKTNWIMHEFRASDIDDSTQKGKNNGRHNDMMLDRWVLSRIYHRSSSKSENGNAIVLHSQSQNPGVILPIATVDVHQNSPQEQPPQDQGQHHPTQGQIMAVDNQDPALVGAPQYHSPLSAVAPSGLPDYPPIAKEDLDWLRDYLIRDPFSLGCYNGSSGPLGFDVDQRRT